MKASSIIPSFLVMSLIAACGTTPSGAAAGGADAGSSAVDGSAADGSAADGSGAGDALNGDINDAEQADGAKSDAGPSDGATDAGNTTGGGQVVFQKFAVDLSQINVGDKIILTWQVAKAASCVLHTNGKAGTAALVLAGSQTLTPTAAATYALVCKDAAGQTATSDQVSVQVAHISAFTTDKTWLQIADPSKNSAQIQLKVTGEALFACRFTDSMSNGILSLSGNGTPATSYGTSMQINKGGEHLITVTCKGFGNKELPSETVTVMASELGPLKVNAGGVLPKDTVVTFTWDAIGVSTCQLTGPDGKPALDAKGQALSGGVSSPQQVKVTQPGTYTLACTVDGQKGVVLQRSAEFQLQVTLTFEVALNKAGGVELRWNGQFAKSCKLTDTAQAMPTIASQGSLTVSGAAPQLDLKSGVLHAFEINCAGPAVGLNANGANSAMTLWRGDATLANFALAKNAQVVLGSISLNNTTSFAKSVVTFYYLNLVTGSLTFQSNTKPQMDFGFQGINMPKLTRVLGDITITKNPSFDTFYLGKLAKIWGDLTISGNKSTVTLNLASLAQVGGALTIDDNASLSKTYLSALAEVGGSFSTIKNGKGYCNVGKATLSIGGKAGVALPAACAP